MIVMESLETSQLVGLWRLEASERVPFIESTRLLDEIERRKGNGSLTVTDFGMKEVLVIYERLLEHASYDNSPDARRMAVYWSANIMAIKAEIAKGPCFIFAAEEKK